MRTKHIRILIAFLLVTALTLPLCSSMEASAIDTIYCSNCGKRIPTESNYCMYCGYRIVYPDAKPSPAYGSWSMWSRNPVFPSPNREVETRTVIVGYNMVHYGTQEAASPHYRMFRNYSIKGSFQYYGARDSYGEKHFTKYVSAAAFFPATTYEPGTFIKGEYAGYQCGTSTAYYFGDDKYVWFVESVEYATEYRYRSIFF